MHTTSRLHIESAYFHLASTITHYQSLETINYIDYLGYLLGNKEEANHMANCAVLWLSAAKPDPRHHNKVLHVKIKM